jgi:hypothetical protein
MIKGRMLSLKRYVTEHRVKYTKKLWANISVDGLNFSKLQSSIF